MKSIYDMPERMRTLIRKCFKKFAPPTGYVCQQGAERRVKRVQTWERGPPPVLAFYQFVPVF